MGYNAQAASARHYMLRAGRDGKGEEPVCVDAFAVSYPVMFTRKVSQSDTSEEKLVF